MLSDESLFSHIYLSLCTYFDKWFVLNCLLFSLFYCLGFIYQKFVILINSNFLS